MPMKRLYILFPLLCLLLLTACGRQPATAKNITLQGKTEAVRYVVKAPVDGKIRGLILDKGERIRKGQPLFGLGTQDESPEVGKASAELAKAQARLNNASGGNNEAGRASAAAAVESARSRVGTARQNFAKMQRLYAIGGISRLKMQQAQQELGSAEAALSAAQTRYEQVNRVYTKEELAQLEKKVQEARTAYDAAVLTVEGSEITSPTTGIVREIWVKNGEAVKKEQPVMEIVSATDCTVTVRSAIPDPRLQEGAEATVTAIAAKKSFPAVIQKTGQNTVTLFSGKKPEEIPEGTNVEIEFQANKQ